VCSGRAALLATEATSRTETLNNQQLFLFNARSKNYGFYAFLLIHIEEIDFAF